MSRIYIMFSMGTCTQSYTVTGILMDNDTEGISAKSTVVATKDKCECACCNPALDK